MRRAFDFYPTPKWATQELLRRVPIYGRVLEPCAGRGDMVQPLADAGCEVVAHDLDPAKEWPGTFDARNDDAYLCAPDWVVTNPPFSCAFEILKKALHHAKRGVAFLLRLSFLEPTLDRGPWLAVNPPAKVFVLPRMSFTGDGKTDSVTCAWVVWDKTQPGPWAPIQIIPRGR